MARDQLLALTTTVDRLLAAGASAAGGNDNLRRHGQTLRDLSQKVPALTPVADGVERVSQATGKQGNTAFIDLLLMARQLRYNLSSHGIAGDLQPAPHTGPWQTSRSVRDLYPIQETLVSAASGREATLREAIDRKVTTDLRLVPALLGSLEDNYAPMADLVAEQAILPLGKAVVHDLLQRLNLHGKTGDVRRLGLLCRIDPAIGADLCWKALKDSSLAVRVKALESLPTLNQPVQAEKAALELCTDKTSEIRAAALSALRIATSPEALDRLLEAGDDRVESVRSSAASALGPLPNPQAMPRLLQELQTAVNELERVAAKKEKPDKKAAKPAKGAKGAKPAPKKDPNKAAREKAVQKVCWLVGILGDRQDADRQPAAEAVLPLTRHADVSIRTTAIQALGGIGPVAENVMPVLLAAIAKRKDVRTALAALVALERIEPTRRGAALPVLLNLLDQGKIDPSLKAQAIRTLPGHTEAYEEEILPRLGKLWKQTHYLIRGAVLTALVQMGPAARSVLPVLLADMINGNYWFFYHQGGPSVFETVDPDGQVVIPILIEGLQSKKGPQVVAALAGLRTYGSKAQSAIPAVSKLLDHKEGHVRVLAEQILAAIHPS
jgi:HEAT repeat protein